MRRHRARVEGRRRGAGRRPGHGRTDRRGDPGGHLLRFRAPATSANLGPGFDAAAVALDLWNELDVEPGEGLEIEGEGADELPRDASHLALRAFALLAPVDGH